MRSDMMRRTISITSRALEKLRGAESAVPRSGEKPTPLFWDDTTPEVGLTSITRATFSVAAELNTRRSSMMGDRSSSKYNEFPRD